VRNRASAAPHPGVYMQWCVKEPVKCSVPTESSDCSLSGDGWRGVSSSREVLSSPPDCRKTVYGWICCQEVNDHPSQPIGAGNCGVIHSTVDEAWQLVRMRVLQPRNSGHGFKVHHSVYDAMAANRTRTFVRVLDGMAAA